MKKIGLTTTVPIEILLAAGYTPIDLNNLFVTHNKYHEYIELAERQGFPKNFCAWIKGIYGACIKNDIKEVVGVTEGDCSNTKVLIEIFKDRGIKIYPFAFPHSHSIKDVEREMKKFMKKFNVLEKEVEDTRQKLKNIRVIAKRIDELTYKELKVTGFENHLYQVSLSDMNTDVETFENHILKVYHHFQKRKPIHKTIRLGYIGVPPMMNDLYDFLESIDAHVIYNEVQREFAFPRGIDKENVYQQYHDYTYPYHIDFRIEKIKTQIQKRQLDGMIHYTQAFCYRGCEHMILKDKLGIPTLHIEGDKLNHLDSRTKLRIEAFIDMLIDKKGGIQCLY